MKQEKINGELQLFNRGFKELNSICSYLAMFPAEVPFEYIKKLTNEGDIVYDPFSGRGTTALQAIKQNRVSISNDKSPLAYVLTKAKTYHVKTNDAIERVKQLEDEFNKSQWKIDYKSDKYKDIAVFYSEHNLTQLDFLRSEVGAKWEKLDVIDNYIMAVALGIAHGAPRKTGDQNNSLYFSVKMPNGYSMAPEYARRYIEKNKLHKLETNIFEQIIYRISKKSAEIISENSRHQAHYGDALESSSLFASPEEYPDLIFTSPPYLNLIKYVEQNWIRFWLLGFDREKTKENIVDDYHARDGYKNFIINFMQEMEKIMKPTTKLVMVIGDVKHHKIKEIMSEIMIELKIKNSKLKLNPIIEEQPLRNKLSRQMGKAKTGKATDIDWVFKFTKVNK